jgi:cell wall-associated NlpC family hydrolase
VHHIAELAARRSVGAVCAAVLLSAVIWAPAQARKPSGTVSTTYVQQRLAGPGRTVVSSSTGAWLATFTDGARTVALAGPRRTFSESTTTATVSTTTWVRLLPKPFAGSLDSTWLTNALANTSPDILAIAMQYQTGAPTIRNAAGLRIAGDADYGPLQPDGTRLAGSDFNDYLGVTWSYPSGTIDAPEADELGALDCSGYMRMVFGYRNGIPLSLSADGGASLPRHSWDIAATAPGIIVILNTGSKPTARSLLQAGDIVAFDASTADGTRIDHVGMYLGRDSLGHDRFISSRKTANGPTLGDLGGVSQLDGSGLYASSFRSARRI